MIWLMTQMWFLLTAAFILGAGIGWWLHSGRKELTESVSVNGDLGGSLAVDHSAPRQPVLYSAPSEGAKDDLTQIIGIDEATETKLNSIGVFYIAQIAGWDLPRARWIEDKLGSPGRIERERWVDQARSVLDQATELVGAES